MASGKKNYFRHSFFARNDDFIITLIDKLGYQGYFLWFSLLEVCGEIAADNYPETFKIHNSRLLRSLRCRQDKLDSFLTLARLESKLSHTRVENNHFIQIPNLKKYLGKYNNLDESNSPNKRKENKRKEKEIENTVDSDLKLLMTPDEIVNLWNQTMPSDIFPSAKSLYSSKNMKLVIECDSLLRKLNLNWLDIFQRIRSSTKLNGADTGFVYIPDVSFCIKPENIEALVNGKYDTPSNEHLKELEKREAEKRAFLGL